MTAAPFTDGLKDALSQFPLYQTSGDDLAAADTQRAVFRNIVDIVSDGFKEPAEVIILSSACGCELDTAFF